MKTEASEYLSLLQEIQNNNVSTFTVMPADEPRFTIETNSRNIIVPSEFSFLSVQNDHRAETIYFEIDRYFDNVDLSQHACVVQFINKSGTTINEGTYPVTSMDIDSVDGKIVFGWEIRNDATQLTGDITFSVRFYSIDNNGNFTYNFNTLTASSYILPSLNIIASGERITATELEVWTDKMNNLASSIESDIITVEEKIEELENYIASIPEDYTALTEEVSQLSSENAELKGDLTDVETKIINVLGSGNIENGGGDVSPINIDFSCRTFVKIKNTASNQAYINPSIYQNGTFKQGFSELYNAGEEKITSIFNVNYNGVHWNWIESGKDITSYEWSVGIQNTNNTSFEYEIFQLKSDIPIRDNDTIIVDVNNDYGCFKYISDAIGYAKSIFDVNTVPITIFIKNGKYNLTYVPINTSTGRYAVLDKGANMISLIGESREGVIIELINTPSKNNKMVEHGGQSTIANITWRNLWNNDGSTVDYRSNAYCIHNDKDYSTNYYYETVVENCNIYSEAFAPIGAGLHNKQKQIYRNCNIVFNSLDTTENGYNKWAPIYVHSPGNPTARDCSLEIDDCTCNAEKGTVALSLPNVSGSLQYTDIPVSIRRSIFVTNGSVVTYVNKDNTLLKSDCALNNISVLNY